MSGGHLKKLSLEGGTSLLALLWTVLCFSPLSQLSAAPDPDIFDGRVQSGERSTTAENGRSGTIPDTEEEDGGGTDEADSEDASRGPMTSGGSEKRDFSEFDQLGGSPVETQGDGKPRSGGKAPQGGSVSGAAADPESPGAATDGPTSESSKEDQAAIGGGNKPRTFESIGGIGGNGVAPTVEVNSSKQTRAERPENTNADKEGATVSSSPNPQAKGSGTGGTGSQTGGEQGAGDFGERLPSGL